MRDIEKELRDLGGRVRDEDAVPLLSHDVLRRIRLRRIGTVAMSLLAVAGLAFGGTYAAGVLIATDPNTAVPAEEGLPTDKGPRCGPPVDFRPTYLPEGWLEDLQVGDGGGGADWPGIVGHYGNDAPPGTIEKADGGFADLIAARKRPFPQGNKEKIRVLDKPASLADIHEGYSVQFSRHGCRYFLLAYGIVREELGRFAQGLRARSTRVPAEPAEDENFAAIWPEDTADAARQGCSRGPRGANDWRHHSSTVPTAVEFGRRVLDWDDALAIVRRRRPDGSTIELRKSASDTGGEATGPAIIVNTHEAIDGCWSVGSVSRLPDRRPTGVGVGVTGRSVDIAFDPLGAESASVEIGYGGRVSTHTWQAGDGQPVHFELEFEPDTTGHFLILMRDATGAVFSAAGGPLPAGDFSAG